MIASIILAAGKGTRMNSTLPKVAINFVGKPMINRVIEVAKKFGSERICVVVGYKKDVVMSVITDANIEFVEQEQQLGTGDAVGVCRDILSDFDGTLVVLCGDTPVLRAETITELIGYHQSRNYKCTVLTTKMDDPASYGRIVRDINGDLQEIVEFKDASEYIKSIDEVNSGIYCFDAKALFSALQLVRSDNAQGEYYLTDTIAILKSQGHKVGAFVCKDSLEITGVNSLEELKELEKSFPS